MLKKIILLHSLLGTSLVFARGLRTTKLTRSKAHFTTLVTDMIRNPRLTKARTPEAILDYLNQSYSLKKAVSWLDHIPTITIANLEFHYNNGSWKHTPKNNANKTM